MINRTLLGILDKHLVAERNMSLQIQISSFLTWCNSRWFLGAVFWRALKKYETWHLNSAGKLDTDFKSCQETWKFIFILKLWRLNRELDSRFSRPFTNFHENWADYIAFLSAPTPFPSRYYLDLNLEIFTPNLEIFTPFHQLHDNRADYIAFLSAPTPFPSRYC